MDSIYFIVVYCLFVFGMVWNIRSKQRKLRDRQGSVWQVKFSIFSSIVMIIWLTILAIIFFVYKFIFVIGAFA
jgi:hypothetical protein